MYSTMLMKRSPLLEITFRAILGKNISERNTIPANVSILQIARPMPSHCPALETEKQDARQSALEVNPEIVRVRSRTFVYC